MLGVKKTVKVGEVLASRDGGGGGCGWFERLRTGERIERRAAALRDGGAVGGHRPWWCCSCGESH